MTKEVTLQERMDVRRPAPLASKGTKARRTQANQPSSLPPSQLQENSVGKKRTPQKRTPKLLTTSELLNQGDQFEPLVETRRNELREVFTPACPAPAPIEVHDLGALRRVPPGQPDQRSASLLGKRVLPVLNVSPHAPAPLKSVRPEHQEDQQRPARARVHREPLHAIHPTQECVERVQVSS